MGFILRFGQAFLEAALTLLVGLITTGVLRKMVGPAGVRRLFGQGWNGLLRGWVAGMLLPVCSIGVIPVAAEMRRAGVSGGTVLSFVLAAPLLNPISFLYGLTLAEPVVISCFALASLFLSTIAGSAWDRWWGRLDNQPNTVITTADEPLPTAGPRRLLAVVVTAARCLTGVYLPYYLLGLAGSALLATIIPFGSLQATMKHIDPTSPLLMLALALPIYSSPLPGMMKIGLMFDHGNSLGAAFVLFIVGIGTNIGLLMWVMITYGIRRSLICLIIWLTVVILLAYITEPLLYDTRKPELDHTHAFDDYANPFTPGYDLSMLLGLTRQKLAERFEPLEQISVYTLSALLLMGWMLKVIDRNNALDRWLTAPSVAIQKDVPWWNRSIPTPILGVIVLMGLVAFSVIGVYIYYPPAEQTLSDLNRVRTDAIVAIRVGKSQEAIRELELMDLLTRKLQVGVYLRTGGLTQEARQAADDFRETLEQLRDHLLAGEVESARHLLPELERTYRNCRRIYTQAANTHDIN
jgi:uncharacterized membrane protein YraQ (UPF0718 family)